ncbi:MAG: hypothetical protein M3O87_01915 [Candidatus Dormibacteraeota bacterium]|nr:hypothetical protein [Candidatus Dormibacteraeota bacterium]
MRSAPTERLPPDLEELLEGYGLRPRWVAHWHDYVWSIEARGLGHPPDLGSRSLVLLPPARQVA